VKVDGQCYTITVDEETQECTWVELQGELVAISLFERLQALLLQRHVGSVVVKVVGEVEGRHISLGSILFVRVTVLLSSRMFSPRVWTTIGARTE
jgi:hypothetical protein